MALSGTPGPRTAERPPAGNTVVVRTVLTAHALRLLIESALLGTHRGVSRHAIPARPEGIAHNQQNVLLYGVVMFGFSRTSRAGFVSSSSAMPSRDFTKSENER